MISPHDGVRNTFIAGVGMTDYKSDLAGRIRDALEGRDRGEVAETIGHQDATSLSKWSKGRQSPDPENIGKLAKATGVSGHWLLTGEGPMYPENPDAERQAYREMVEIVRRTEGVRAVDAGRVELSAEDAVGAIDDEPGDRKARGGRDG